MDRKERRRRAIIRRRIFIACVGVVVAVLIAAIAFGIGSAIESKNPDADKHSAESLPDSAAGKGENTKKSVSATVLNTGDILIHDNLLWGAKQEDGTYDFSAFFKESRSIINSSDFAVANLEVTLGGEAAGSYRGYPGFNSPDSLIDNLKADGFDMLLTSNNHSLDTGLAGLKRTVQQLKARGMGFLGTKETSDDPTYIVKDINGIKIGMVCYTYGTNSSATGAASFINTFSSSNLDAFYSAAQSVIDSMRSDGAEAIVFYMHWGEEYKTSPNTYQESIAQRLCNMGVDVIVGGHPHVIQPIDILYSEDSQNTTVCLYSMGNAISNQRIEEMTGVCTTGHTEDGVFFSYTFTKDSDGDVSLSGVDIIPTWVNRYGSRGDYDYTVYSLKTADMADSYGLDSTTAQKARASYERTMAIVGEGLKRCKDAIEG